MPLLLALGGLLLEICGSMVGRALLALGMSYITYTGFDTSVNWLMSQIQSNFTSMPSQIVSFLAWLWVDKAISMIFGAYAAALVVKIGSSAKFTKLMIKG